VERDRARRKAAWRLAILGVAALLIAIAALVFLATREVPDIQPDPNKTAERTAP